MIEASMPSNIALIKYMGKKDSINNIPDNSSLSYTLNNFKTHVTLTPIDNTNNNHSQDIWDNRCNIDLSDKKRFTQHLDFLRKKCNINQYYKIHSENNFPASCGLASSASSFAALTECALKIFNINHLSPAEKADLSRVGSGSSCRSFLGNWVLWEKSTGIIKKIELPYENLIHYVIVVSTDKKAISSSQAHKLVQTSLLYSDRPARAEKRLENLVNSFYEKDWEKSYYLVWQECQDMHALFETAEKPFGYLTLSSYFVLNTLRDYWKTHKDGPLITVDAGPNVHVLFREDQASMATLLTNAFRERFLVL